MGTWNIKITGTGAHHNKDYPKDADRMAARFVQELREAGHQIHDAEIVLCNVDGSPLAAGHTYTNERTPLNEPNSPPKVE